MVGLRVKQRSVLSFNTASTPGLSRAMSQMCVDTPGGMASASQLELQAAGGGGGAVPSAAAAAPPAAMPPAASGPSQPNLYGSQAMSQGMPNLCVPSPPEPPPSSSLSVRMYATRARVFSAEKPPLTPPHPLPPPSMYSTPDFITPVDAQFAVNYEQNEKVSVEGGYSYSSFPLTYLLNCVC
jgi:hypothetical protein